ncbi:sigma-54 dependent transcriptional regulator [Guyparkeria hydrothermalis]|uniref:sigma-54-dependent transcriptional regulator n=1 Tax=Guyparkeria hydrothermalis TaxID=923 RepID=UPI002020280D|nr:sigma-54 dependent transcriptional regulator [Guyparkeria hydrothermalis]MCL7751201.1 sigma-54 dependent transcriptional regulator [Guyparkeria hydrothermalis]
MTTPRSNDNPPVIAFVDDDERASDLFSRYARTEGLTVHGFQSVEAAQTWLADNPVDLVISDLKMPGMNGLEFLEWLRGEWPELPVILITGYSTIDNAIQALRLGASDFVKKPYDPEELIELARRLLHEGPAEPPPAVAAGERAMLGQSRAIEAVYHIIDKIRDVRINVMIEGESGSGKELAARATHERSDFAGTPYIVIDCGALTDTLLENELFGHEKGAFTGANTAKPGLLEVASGGTVFLDEIGNISDAMQVKLLRVVQEQEITRVGGVQTIPIDVRFIVASNRNLAEMVKAGEFRHDLYHRLNVVRLQMPPLRERREDIPVLAQHFIDEFAGRFRRPAKRLTERAERAILDYPWPGNVRELKNAIERAVALSDSEEIDLDLAGEDTAPAAGDTGASAIDADHPTLEELERRYIEKTLDYAQGNREKTANILGINKSTLWRKLQNYEKK